MHNERQRVVIKFQDLYQKQRAAFFGDERISVCEASTKAGKSVGALSWLFSQGIKERPGSAQLWVSPVYPQARTHYKRAVTWLTKMDPEKATGWDENRSELIVTLPGDSLLHFKGGDNPDSIYGSDYSAVVVDEASRCKEEAWWAIRSTTTATRGPIRIVGNVKGRKNWAYRLARKAEADESMHYEKIIAHDAIEAGVITQQDVDEAKAVLPEHIFRELYLAEPSDDGGNPFGIDAIRRCILQEQPNTSAVVYGIDLGKAQDYTVIIGLDADGRVCHFQRFRLGWTVTIERIENVIGTTEALIDSTGVGDPIVENLQQRHGNVTGYNFGGTNKKQQLMLGLMAAIQQQRTSFIDDGPLVAELEAFEFVVSASGHVKYEAPSDMHDDCVMALALAVEAQRTYAPPLLMVADTKKPRSATADGDMDRFRRAFGQFR